MIVHVIEKISIVRTKNFSTKPASLCKIMKMKYYALKHEHSRLINCNFLIVTFSILLLLQTRDDFLGLVEIPLMHTNIATERPEREINAKDYFLRPRRYSCDLDYSTWFANIRKFIICSSLNFPSYFREINKNYRSND